MSNPLIREHTTCGSCDEIKDFCVIRTVKTVHAGWQMVELCRSCLCGMATVIDHHCIVCEHGIREDEFCEECNKEYKRAAEAEENQ